MTNAEHVEICKKLKSKFQNFIKDNCAIPETFANIEKVYRDFFNRFALELDGGGITHSEQYDRQYRYNNSWTIFTTNYDTCLEYYWSQVVQADFDTNFMWDNRRKISILTPRSILAEPSGVIKLFKLHGSVNWLIEGKTQEVVEVQERGKSFMGRDYTEELMLCPLAAKELYLEPYISMLVRLNRELKRKPI